MFERVWEKRSGWGGRSGPWGESSLGNGDHIYLMVECQRAPLGCPEGRGEIHAVDEKRNGNGVP
jgi:hypothetical protein